MQVVDGVVLQGSVPVCVVLTLLWLHGAVSAFYIIPVWSVYILSILHFYTNGVGLQASVRYCVVLTLLWLYGAVSAFYIIPVWYVYILSILHYYTNTCADRLASAINIRGIDKPRLSAVRHVSVVSFLKPIVLVFCILYHLEHTQIDTLFIPGDLDQLIACIHLPLVFNCAAQETSRLLSFFYNVGKLCAVQLNIPNLWWLLTGLCYLCVHACVLIYVVDLLYASAMSTAATFGFDNYITDVDMNESLFDYRQHRFQCFNSEYNRSANLKMAGTETHYWLHSYGLIDVIKNEHDVTLEFEECTYNVVNPSIRYLRFVGEYINISCSFKPFAQQDKFGDHMQFWKHNGRRLVPEKGHIGGISRRYVNKSYIVQMYLAIRHITESDFGNYSCIDQFTMTADLTEGKYEGKYVIIKSLEYGRIQVEKLPVLEHVVYVPPGNVMHTASNFDYLVMPAEDMPLSAEYTVNGKPLDVVCPSASVFPSCSFQSAVFLTFKHKRFASSYALVFLYNVPLTDTAVVDGVFVEFCVCPDAYGWHKLSLIREIYSDTQGKKVVEFDHPLRLLVLPAPSMSLLPFWNDAGLYDDIAEEIKGMHSERDIPTTTLKLIKAHAYTKRWFTSIYHLAIWLSLIYYIFIIMRWSFVKYCKLLTTPAIFWRVRSKNKATNCANHENACDNGELPRHYDAYISHCEDDYEWVTTKLVPYLEDISNIRVCLPDRDLRHGRNELHEMSDHMDASSKIIVVLSPAYLTDYRCNQLQMHDMVLSSLYEKKRGPREILLFTLRPCTVVRPVRWNLEVDTMNWSSLRNKREQLHDISNWVLGNNTPV